MPLPASLAERLRIPVVASPMFIISGPDLVIAQSVSGVIGSFPSLNARPQSMLSEWLIQINTALAKHDASHPERLAAPYAVNLIVHRSNDRLDADLATIVDFEVPIVITSLGARPDVNDAVHSYGGIILHDVTTNQYAQKAVAKGADGLIAVAAGAGGHAGVQSPFALVQEIRAWFDGPLLLSGSISHGSSILGARAIGADMAYVGSAFIATHEANAEHTYKQMIVDSSASDIVYSDYFTGVHGNYLRDSIITAGLDPDGLAHLSSGEIDFASTVDTEKPQAPQPWRDVWGAGQGIGAVRRLESTGEVVKRLTSEYDRAKHELLRQIYPPVGDARSEPQGVTRV